MAFETRALAGFGGRVTFHATAEFIGLVEAFDAIAAQMLAPRPAPALLEFDDAIYVDHPRHRGLYDRDGRRIEASRLLRTSDTPRAEFAPCEPELESLRAHATLDEPVVFRSIFFKHWGHFLLESTARLWPDAPELASLKSLFAFAWGETEISGRYAEALAHLGVEPLKLEHRRVRLRKVFVPTPSYAMGTFAHPQHLEAPQRLTRKLARGAPRDPRPVYLSRTDPALGGHYRRRLANEAELEAALEARGARIAHMQRMSLAEQIELVNAHRVFIGPFGSAFHNLLFSLNGPEISTYVLVGAWMPRDFVLVDSLLGNRAHYLALLARLDEAASRDAAIDVGEAVRLLAELGAI